MTFRVHFYADQAFFSMIKRTIEKSKIYTGKEKLDFEPEESATAIIICHSACEAFLNILAYHITLENFNEFERKSILDKIEILYRNKDLKVDWSVNPFQDIRNLDKVRNWLTHFKKTDIGLINSMGHWVVDDFNKRPKIDDYKELKYERAERYYQNVRSSLAEICKIYDCNDYFSYLETEDYWSYLVG